MQQKLNANALFSARLDNNLDVFALRERAADLRRPQAEPGEARQKRIDDAVRQSIKAGGYYQGIGGSLGSYLANQAGGFDNLTGDEKRRIYEARQFGNLQASGAYSEQNEKSLISFLASERMQSGDQNLSLNERLQKQLNILNSGARTAEEKAIADRKLLSLSSSLDPSQLNSDLREKIALANEREADRKSNYERDSLKAQQESVEVQRQIADNNKKLLEIAEKQGVEGLKLYLEVLDKTSGGANVKKDSGKSADNQDVSNWYNQYNRDN